MPEESISIEAGDTDTSNWDEIARGRVASVLDKSTDLGHSLTLHEVVRDRIWPFYSNWIHLVVGACTRTAEFDRNDADNTIVSVSIWITCERLPSPHLQNIIKKYTMELVPENFRSGNQVVVEIVKGTTTMSGSRTMETLAVKSGTAQLSMGDTIRSHISGLTGPYMAQLRSSGPWFRASNDEWFLYTNEHVVRPGVSLNQHTVVTHPDQKTIGKVVLTSEGDDATMKCHNLKVDETVRKNNSFLADWAIIKLEKVPDGPIETVHWDPERLCHHVNNFIHIPREGKAVAVGASSKERRGGPWIGVYTTEYLGDGLPTILSPGKGRSNTIDLACWSLCRPKKAEYKEKDWYENGLGIHGDSGAGVVDCKTGHLCGLIIGEVKGVDMRTNEGRRTALIIDIKDVVLNTLEKAKGVLDITGLELNKCDCHIRLKKGQRCIHAGRSVSSNTVAE